MFLFQPQKFTVNYHPMKKKATDDTPTWAKNLISNQLRLEKAVNDIRSDIRDLKQANGYTYEHIAKEKMRKSKEFNFERSAFISSIGSICELFQNDSNSINIRKMVGIVESMLLEKKHIWKPILFQELCKRHKIVPKNSSPSDDKMKRTFSGIKKKDQFLKEFLKILDKDTWSDLGWLMMLNCYSKHVHDSQFELKMFDQFELDMKGSCVNLLNRKLCTVELVEIESNPNSFESAGSQINRCGALMVSIFQLVDEKKDPTFPISESISIDGIIVVPFHPEEQLDTTKYVKEITFQFRILK